MHSKCISNYSVYRTFGRLKATHIIAVLLCGFLGILLVSIVA